MSIPSFLQTKDWAEFQKSLGREVFEYNKDGIRAYIIKHEIPFRKNYLYIPHGPEIDFNSMIGGFKNPAINFIKYLKDLGKEQKSIFVKVEPLTDSVAQILAENKLKKSKREIQPSKTVIIDLSKNEDELLKNMHHKTRYNIGVAQKYNIRVNESNDTKMFWQLIKVTAKRDKFHAHDKEYYEKLLEFFASGKEINTKIFVASHDNDPVAAAIVLMHEGTGYYLHGASNYESRSFMAPYLLHWQIIKYLKEKGFKNYDLWGVDAKKWPGVTRFKLGWGGRMVEYPGSFDLTISWPWHTLYKIFQKTRI